MPVTSSDQSGPGEMESLLTLGKRRSRVRKVVAALAAVLVLGGGGLVAYEMTARSGDGDSVRFETAAVGRGDLESSITSTGTVEALNTVEVGAEISGKIKTINADFNDPVEVGQLLVELDPQQQKAAVSEAKARVLAAQAGRSEAEAALLEATQAEARVRALSERGLASSKELEAATASEARAKASLKSARANAALAGAAYDAAVDKLGKTEIRSPIAGTVLSREVEVGQAINAGMQTPVLFVIAEDLRRMRLSSQVDEADIGVVAVGQRAKFTVDAYPQREFDSEVLSIRNVPTTDQNVVSYEVLLSVDNADLLLKPGMTATVDIITDAQEDALIVPNKALRFQPPASSGSRRMRGPPGLPFLGGKRGDRRGGSEGGGGAGSLREVGEIGSGEGVVWVLEADRPAPLKVRKLATDGANTAIECEGLEAGAEVIVDLAEGEAE